MTEGLRALPWLEDARRDEALFLRCDFCLENADEAQRRALGCGWLPPHEDAQPWQHRGDKTPSTDEIPAYTTCAGYTTRLPDVVDAATAWSWWDKGQLHLLVAEPSPALRDGIDELAAAIGAYQSWKSLPKEQQ